ncbi:MAG TPA: MFS transporter [Candidatus Limnocylindrales bacterium]|nr:MFS transporter [Candidatus Limnocylindrales bacterium]
MTSKLVEIVAPARLGTPFRWLFSSSMITNLGDGVIVAAGPLLVASLTSDPFLVSLAFLFEYLPSLVLGAFAGVLVDRVDRRRMVIVVNLVRAAVFVLLAAAILANVVSIALVLGALLLLSAAETFGDLAGSSLLPRLVPRRDLGIANARLQSTYLLPNQLIGPPIGAFLFALGASIPFVADALCYVAGAVFISRISASVAGRPAATGADGEGETNGEYDHADDEAADTTPTGISGIWHELVEGFRWLMAHPPMRTLVLTILAFNVTFGAAWSVLVLYARDQLQMDTVGYGLLTTASAIGGIVGTSAYGALEHRFSLGNIMRIGLLIETFTHLTLALTRSPAVALIVMVVFGAHAFVWGTTATTVRQRAVPDALMGRVSGIYRVAVFGGMVAGAPIGGALASAFGITAPFWFGFVGSAILVTILWREFRHIAHDAEVDAAASA